jgi:nucleoside-triphosphatase
MTAQGPRHVLLTGAPGCGKTTVVMRVLRLLRDAGLPIFGFWTEEERRGSLRQGFALELVSGGRDRLASVEWPGPPRVGRYGVRPEVMERLVVPEIERGLAEAKRRPDVVLVMDEIGKMELFSRAFQRAALGAFDSGARVVATVLARPHPFAEALKRRPDVALVVVTPQNREGLPQQVVFMLKGAANSALAG